MDRKSIVRALVFGLAWLNTLLASKGYKTIPYVDEIHVAMILSFAISAYGFIKHNFYGKKGTAQKEAIKNLGK